MEDRYMVKENNIIKVHNEYYYVTNVSNQGTYKCKDKHGRLVWMSYLQPITIVK